MNQQKSKKGFSMKLFTIKEAAELLAVKPSRIRTAVFKNEIAYVKLGRLIRFSQEQLNQWISKGTKGGCNEINQ
jgi:excisionase family DNA binding protein